MWNNDRPADQHQVVDADARPLPPRVCLFADAQVGANLPALVQANPDKVAFLDAHDTARNVGAVVKDKRDRNLGGADGFLDDEELLAQPLALNSLPLHRGLGHGLWHDADRRVGGELASFACGAVLVAALWLSEGRPRDGLGVLFLVIFEGQLARRGFLLLLFRRLGRAIARVARVWCRSLGSVGGRVAFLGLALLLFEHLGASLAKVRQMDETDSVAREPLLRRLVLRREPRGGFVGHGSGYRVRDSAAQRALSAACECRDKTFGHTVFLVRIDLFRAFWIL